MKIIAFGHRKGVGKDTATGFLITELRMRYKGLNIQRVAFADKVKEVAHSVFGWAGLRPGPFYDSVENRHLREVKLPALGKTPRELWIGVGNGIRSATGHDSVWSDYVFNSIKVDVMIISDLRFPGEADAILDRGGYLFKINCPWAPVVVDGADDVLSGYNKWTRILENNSDLGTFYNNVKAIAEEFFK